MVMKISKHIFSTKLVCLTIFFLTLFISSCEDVVDVNLKTDPPRLVVDASINWEKGTSGSTQKIVLTTTTDYYNTTIPKASGATIKVKNSENTEFIFTEDGTSGVYFCTNFIPSIGETYTLSILYKGETYTASETMQPIPKIDKILQKSDGGILKDQYEVFFYFKDVANVANYAMARFITNYLKIPTFYVGDDRFIDGEEANWSYSDEDLKPGNTLEFTNYGISKRYYNYMNILINVSGAGSGGGPFQTAPVSVRGNLVNETNIDNYALGYFSLSETEKILYTVE